MGYLSWGLQFGEVNYVVNLIICKKKCKGYLE